MCKNNGKKQTETETEESVGAPARLNLAEAVLLETLGIACVANVSICEFSAV